MSPLSAALIILGHWNCRYRFQAEVLSVGSSSQAHEAGGTSFQLHLRFLESFQCLSDPLNLRHADCPNLEQALGRVCQ